MLTVQDDMVVSIDYALHLEDDLVADSSAEGRPLTYVQGRGQIISGLERQIVGMALDEEKDVFLSLYLGKHPHLEDFVMSPSCALVRVVINTYVVVSRFQHVMMLHMKP